jgi:hypothetical protein
VCAEPLGLFLSSWIGKRIFYTWRRRLTDHCVVVHALTTLEKEGIHEI